ncbi:MULTISPECIES: hypothetical protein [unclassified Adlercreutzia]|uniref:hypothetical protein n=1 Tax=unclassified Adlercreutzia TaxID=2636013 RepID=UPI0013EE1CFA|nr:MULTISPECIES: hypothetical protein [unclassified Adlercreutzia]
MKELVLTPGTVALLAVVAAWAVWAVRRITRRGLCDCGDHCGDAGVCASGCSGCSRGGCGAAEKMVADMGRSLEDPKE